MIAVRAASKVLLPALMFALSLVLLGVAALTERYWPLFLMVVPLLVVPWVLTRPAPEEQRAGEPMPRPPAPEPPGHQPQEVDRT
jgi:hypothetical protein